MKKMLTMFVAVVMVLTMATPAFAASFTDTAGKNCETAVEVLAALGIVEGKAEGAYEPDSSLTRAEMATIILRTMNMAQAAEGKDIFTDVPSSHWAYANIAAAYGMGIVNGTSETTFEPDKTVTYEQAVKMVVAALGYSVQADALGGYPSGYLAKATQLDLLKGVEKGGEMKRGNMAVLLYNALDTELFLQYTFGEEAYDFETNKTKTLLSYYHKVDHVVATVEATYAASAVSPAPKLLSDEVKIGGVTMKVGETDAQNMLGMRADVYTREDEITEKPIILAIVPRQTVEAIDLVAKDIEGLEGLLLSYEDASGTVQKADLTNATVIYNGRVAAKDEAHLKPAIGTVRLIADNNEYTYAIVESFTNYVVDMTNVEDHTLYFKGGAPSMVIDPADNSTVIALQDAEGKPVTIADVAEWDILSIAKSEDDKVTRIYRSNTVAEGKITEMSAEEVVIAGTSYPVAPSVFGTLSVGMTAGFYLDYTGAVAALNEAYQAGGSYGWLVSAATTKGLNGKPQLKIFTGDAEMKIFDTAATVQLNGVGTKQENLLNPGAYSGVAIWSDEKEAILVDADGDTVPQLIKYEVNENGLITSIDTAKNQSNPNLPYAEKYDNNFSMDWYWHLATELSVSTNEDKQKEPTHTNNANNAAEFDGTMRGNDAADKQIEGRLDAANGGKLFFSHVTADNATKFFSIPSDPGREEEYKIINLKNVKREAMIQYKCLSFYDVNEEYYCGAMVLRGDLSKTKVEGYPNEEVPVALITGASITLSKEGEVQNTLKLFTASGSTMSVAVEEGMEAYYYNTASDITKDTAWYSKDDAGEKVVPADRGAADYLARNVKPMYIAVSDLVPGDVIQYETDAEGKLIMANVVFRKDYAKENTIDGKKIVSMELHQRGDNATIRKTHQLANYQNTGKVMMNGPVKMVTDAGVIIDVVSVQTDGTMQSKTYERMLTQRGSFVLWDSEKETWRAITMADIRKDDNVFTYWSGLYQELVVVYRDK